jgi:Protein of unknown function (DUF3105)
VGRRVAPVPVGETPIVMRAFAAVLLVLGVAAACGDDDAPATGCGPVEEQAIDAASTVHVIAGAVVDYETDPPTSGPHAAVGGLLESDPVLDAPLPGPVQVGLLEAGVVLVQWSAAAGDEAASLDALGRAGEVVVAPGESLPAPVVATAWGASLRCETPDEALDAFIDARVGGGPGRHP